MDYVAAIEAALATGWNIELSRLAYRWYGLEFSRSCVNMRVSFAPESRYRRSFISRIAMRALRTLVDLPQERWDLFRRKSMPEAQELVYQLFTQGLESSERAQPQARFVGSIEDEDLQIRSSLGQLGANLFAANPADRPSKLQREFIAAGIVLDKEFR
jgi:hypothetical protein